MGSFVATTLVAGPAAADAGATDGGDDASSADAASDAEPDVGYEGTGDTAGYGCAAAPIDEHAAALPGAAAIALGLVLDRRRRRKS